ncbi:CDP-alcohol phosphatidyltransferase family protein [Micromonospora yasonensis]|uniref:CDP-alcohol phosphatidyltransferase family protein n=1 Tax=Micromonospora yasonensis TaxID=1128667 RepID=UPI002232AAC1|nr:CDP-alcohol phosphatidyltransferase family protein [Micromonospora yasonensis]MCW3845223.1 CDP-alcohol phosphatidyltransferase family protein [Micromonospora yasonensis]
MVGTQLNWDQYATAWARLHGGFDPRVAAPAVRAWLRFAYHVGYILGRLRIGPTPVTAVGVLLCFCVPLLVGRPGDGPFLGALFVLLAAVADSVDGAVAVTTNRTTRLGYVYDSVADRLGEAAWLTAFWLLGAPGALVAAAGGLSWLHEYVRARAVAAGMREIGVVTVAERPTRVCVALAGLLVAGLTGLIDTDVTAGTITMAATVWVLLAGFGLGQLLAAVRRALIDAG